MNGPATRSTLMVLAAGNVAGAAFILVNYAGAAGSVRFRSEVTSATFAAIGVVLAGIGNTLFLAGLRRTIAGRRADLGARTKVIVSACRAELTRRGVETAVAAVGDGALVAAERGTLFHRSGCPLVARKTTTVASRDAHQRAGRRPCGVCEPQREVVSTP